MIEDLKTKIESVWENRELLKDKQTIDAIENVIALLDKGVLRVAEKNKSGWQVNEWVKKAVLLYFPIRQMETMEAGPVSAVS